VCYDLPDELTVEADGPVRTVTINRAAQRNSVNKNLHWAMANVWRQLAADTAAKVVILTGAGRAFCAGGDLNWIATFLDDPVARDESIREGAQIIEEMLRFPLPVIAAVNGPAVGLGCSAALLCDILLISESAYLADPHVAVGLVAGDGGAAPGELLPEAAKLAQRLAAQPPEALRGTKRVVNMYLSQVLGGPMQAGFAAEVATMQTDDHRQRLLDFQQKATARDG
jgi:enoyl-CoA hydratase